MTNVGTERNHEMDSRLVFSGKRRFNIKLWKIFTDCFNCLPIAAIVDEKIFCCHGGLSPDLQSMEQIRRIMRPTDVPDSGLLCDLLWSDPDKEVNGWGENDRGVSFTFGADIVSKFLNKHDLDLICRAHQVCSVLSVHLIFLISSFIRLLKMGMSFSLSVNSLHFSLLRIIAANSTMPVA